MEFPIIYRSGYLDPHYGKPPGSGYPDPHYGKPPGFGYPDPHYGKPPGSGSLSKSESLPKFCNKVREYLL